MLEKKGRLRFNIPAEQWIEKSERLSFLRFIPVDNEIAAKSVQLDSSLHPDPADRIIIATAKVKKLPLVTKDRQILAYEGVSTIW